MKEFELEEAIKDIPFWLQSGINKKAIEFAEKFGTSLADQELTTTQIRNVYGEIKRIQMQEASNALKADVLLLKPKLAYAQARGSGSSKSALSFLFKVMNAGVDAIFHGLDEAETGNLWFERFERFAQFFEAVIAYHRAREATKPKYKPDHDQNKNRNNGGDRNRNNR